MVGGRAIDEDGELFELNGEVDGAEADVGGDGEGDGGEIEDAADTGGDELVGDALGAVVGDGHDGQADVEAGDGGLQFGHGVDDERAAGGADLGGIGVEDGGEAEAFFFEPFIGQECAAEVAGSDEEDVPGPICAEDLADLGDEVIDAVADARVAELAEVGEVFSDLGIGECEAFAELLAGDGSTVVAFEGFELSQVEAEASQGGVWG